MDILELKKWINNNLCYSRGLVCKKCNKNWFRKYSYESWWQEIHIVTSYLDKLNPTFPQRIWHILNDVTFVKCANSVCNNQPTFFSFNKGYLKTCCPKCAQNNPETVSKIKSTNMKKYGVEYGLSNKLVINKRIKSNIEKYGVDNVSKLSRISTKKKKTCKKNYGTQWFFERRDLMKNILIEKYGVDNVQKVKSICEKRATTVKNDFYEELLVSDRFKNKVKPAFLKEDYRGVGEFYNFECLSCGNIFEYQLRWDRIPRCNICYPTFGTSLFEMNVLEHIKTILPDDLIISNSKDILSDGLELDIYIPSKNIAIECDGLYWHGEVGGNKNKNYHLNKTINCQKLGIRLIHIFEDEWKDKEKLIKLKLKHILGINDNHRIYARNCEVNIISTTSIKSEFLTKNHIQGNDASSIILGLYTKEQFPKLVSVMTFGGLRKALGNKSDIKGEYELVRYASSKTVIGGASKLLSYFVKHFTPQKIVSYADRRWSLGNLYEKLGFKKVSDGSPNYWYFGRGNSYKRYHRFGFAKHTLSKKLKVFDQNLTEWENMKNNGYDRIWDCGSIKYEMSF